MPDPADIRQSQRIHPGASESPSAEPAPDPDKPTTEDPPKKPAVDPPPEEPTLAEAIEEG